MKLQKAIEILNKYLPTNRWPPNPDLAAAMQLGIEAAKYTLSARDSSGVPPYTLLPGETSTFCKFCGLPHPGIECPDRGSEK